MWGYQGWEDIEWWTCARAKENMTTRHRWSPRCQIAHGWKRVNVSPLNNVTSFLALYFSFHLIHPSHIFLATPLLYFSSFSITLSFSHLYFLTFLFFFLSFPYTYFSLYFSLSWHLFLSFKGSQLLSFLNAHNLNFKQKPCLRRDETLKVGCVQGMRCTKEMYRFGYGIRRCTGLPMWKSCYRMHDEASNKR
jgi:hypothetical protein